MASSCSSPPDEPKRPHPTSRAWLCLFLDARTGVDLGVLRLGTLPPPPTEMTKQICMICTLSSSLYAGAHH